MKPVPNVPYCRQHELSTFAVALSVEPIVRACGTKSFDLRAPIYPHVSRGARRAQGSGHLIVQCITLLPFADNCSCFWLNSSTISARAKKWNRSSIWIALLRSEGWRTRLPSSCATMWVETVKSPMKSSVILARKHGAPDDRLLHEVQECSCGEQSINMRVHVSAQGEWKEVWYRRQAQTFARRLTRARGTALLDVKIIRFTNASI